MTVPVELHTLKSAQLDRDDDVCVISQEPFSSLINNEEEDKNSCFVKGEPQIVIGRLPCGHNFGLLPLMQYFVLGDGMRCPLCRSGCTGSASIESVPLHLQEGLRKELSKRAQAQQQQERDELDRVWSDFVSNMDQIRAPATLIVSDPRPGRYEPPVSAVIEMQILTDQYQLVHSINADAVSIRGNRALFENLHNTFGQGLRDLGRMQTSHHSRFILWFSQGTQVSFFEMSPVQMLSIVLSGTNTPLAIFLPLRSVRL